MWLHVCGGRGWGGGGGGRGSVEGLLEQGRRWLRRVRLGLRMAGHTQCSGARGGSTAQAARFEKNLGHVLD
jgi:hypothetical protein